MKETNLQIQNSEAQPLLPANQAAFCDHARKHKMKVAATLSVFNGVLFLQYQKRVGKTLSPY